MGIAALGKVVTIIVRPVLIDVGHNSECATVAVLARLVCWTAVTYVREHLDGKIA